MRLYWVVFIGLLVSLSFPLRVISVWWINPVLYICLMLVCLYTTLCFVHNRGWKHMVVLIMIVCTVLAGLNGLISLFEIGNCWVEDNRYTQLIACTSGGMYQQIGSLPIGMQGYCYYCLWY